MGLGDPRCLGLMRKGRGRRREGGRKGQNERILLNIYLSSESHRLTLIIPPMLTSFAVASLLIEVAKQNSLIKAAK